MALGLLSAGLAGLLVWLLGPWAVRFCQARGLMASQAEDRHIHTNPTPHGGGFLLPLVVTPLGLVLVWSLNLPFAAFLTALLLGGLFVALVGWRDDVCHLQPQLRLAAHLLAVGVGLVFLPQLFDFMPLGLEKLILLLGWGWFVNLYNFMDGADGLAMSEAVFISAAAALLVPAFAPLALLITAAGLGFLRVNYPPARVFMGDVCSTWLGYVLGGLLLVCCGDDTWAVIWPLATITLVFCADATSTLIRRIATGHKPWEPHKTFWFHRFLHLGYSHRALLVRVVGLNMALLAVAYGFLKTGYPALSLPAGLVIVALAARHIRQREAATKPAAKV